MKKLNFDVHASKSLQKETGISEGVKSAENQFLVQAKGLVKKT